MTVWLYTEAGLIQKDGPFFSIEAAMRSRLWMWPRVCVWFEVHTAGGWLYENVRFDEGGWLTTSRGLRPAELIRPACLEEATPIVTDGLALGVQSMRAVC